MRRVRFITQTLAYMLILVWSITSCQTKDSKTVITQQIQHMENELFQIKNGVINKKEAANMIHQYLVFVDQYPKDSLSPYYLFKAADVSINAFHSNSTIDLFNRLLNDYPDFEKAPQALFLKAFTYDNYLQQYDKAQTYYELFLKKYPDHIFANDAALSLRNLGKKPEDIIKEFKYSKLLKTSTRRLKFTTI